jgi:hypothetical protein
MRRSAASESRPDPKPRRRRPTEDGYLQLINKDPTQHYCWAHKTEITGRPHYEAIGYTVSVVREGGVRSGLKPNQTLGEEITSLDCVLMEIPLEDFEEIQAVGEFGTTGQEFLDRLTRGIFKPDGSARRLRDMEQALVARDADDLEGSDENVEAYRTGRY